MVELKKLPWEEFLYFKNRYTQKREKESLKITIERETIHKKEVKSSVKHRVIYRHKDKYIPRFIRSHS